MFWKKRIKLASRSLQSILATKKSEPDILDKEFVVLQKVLDKASKRNVIHKNKANRLKSRYAKKIAAKTEAKSKS